MTYPAGIYVAEDGRAHVPIAGTGGATSPASGTWRVGDIAQDTTGALWSCTVAGTPGTWVAVGGGGSAASEAAAGIVELATAAETATGTDNTRAVHPAGAAATYIPSASLGVPPTAGEYWGAPISSTTQGQAIGQLRLGPVWLPAAISLVGLRATVTSAGSGGNTMTLLVYSADPTTRRPGALFKNGGTIDGTSATAQEVTFTATPMPAGLYWVGVLPLTGGGATIRVTSQSDVALPTTNDASLQRGNACFYQSGLSAVPDPAVAALASALGPTVLLKVG